MGPAAWTLAALAWQPVPADEAPTLAPPAASAAPVVEPAAPAFARADAPREWNLPADHRAHPEYALEWWYLTGELRTAGGRRFGYQATFFRTALSPPRAERRESPFAANQLVLWHGSVTDLGERRFTADSELARVAAGWAEASDRRLAVRLGPHSLEAVAPDRWELRAGVEAWRLELDYELDRPPVLNGKVPGWSRKGVDPGNSSYHVSRVQIPTTGTLVAPDGTRHEVTGRSWFDQEFGSSQLDAGQVGWDWFSANLSDGSALMVYQLREKGGRASPRSSGTFTTPDGSYRHLQRAQFTIEVEETWTSPGTGGTYPVAWTLRVPSEQLVLKVRPVLKDQERGAGSEAEAEGVTYWEGLVDYEGSRAGRPVRGAGYVELVGYAREFELMR